MNIHEAAENYLETIYILHLRNGCVRSIDIASELRYSKPTISIAMKQFRADGYIETDAGGCITLTEKGLSIARRMYERHVVLTELLTDLGVGGETARRDACKIEHDLSDESFERIKAFCETERGKRPGETQQAK